MKPIARHQLDTVRRIEIPVSDAGPTTNLLTAALMIDRLVVYSLNGPPTGGTAGLIRSANEQSAPVLALDIPSGLDTDEGAIYEPVIHAAAMLTLDVPKKGLRAMGAEHYACKRTSPILACRPSFTRGHLSISRLGTSLRGIASFA